MVHVDFNSDARRPGFISRDHKGYQLALAEYGSNAHFLTLDNLIVSERNHFVTASWEFTTARTGRID